MYLTTLIVSILEDSSYLKKGVKHAQPNTSATVKLRDLSGQMVFYPVSPSLSVNDFSQVKLGV